MQRGNIFLFFQSSSFFFFLPLNVIEIIRENQKRKEGIKAKKLYSAFFFFITEFYFMGSVSFILLDSDATYDASLEMICT